MQIQFTLKSANSKVGPIPVTTTSKDSCPAACPLASGNGCYADNGPLAAIWRSLTTTAVGGTFAIGKNKHAGKSISWDALCSNVAALPQGQLWRHNQAGDLPPGARTNEIDGARLSQLVEANKGRKGFSYTHYPVEAFANAKAISAAIANGFTINLSANTLAHADTLADHAIAPVVVVLSADVSGKADIRTPKGRKVVVCPATYPDTPTFTNKTNCKSCGLCQIASRNVIVGFPAHGATRKRASAIAMS